MKNEFDIQDYDKIYKALRMNYEGEKIWRQWIDKIPYIKWPADWEVNV